MVEATITAYRAWRVTASGQLFSVAMSTFEWTPGVTMTARCTNGLNTLNIQPGPPPHERSHPCGFHAWKTKQEAQAYSTDRRGMFGWPTGALALGVVELGGRVWEHEKGYRSSRALPLALVAASDPDMTQRLSVASDVHCVPIIPFEEA